MACETEQAQLDAAEVEWHAYQEDCAAGDHNACRDALAAYNKVLVLRQKLQQCLAPPPQSNLRIAGIERTQAIQFFLWNGQGTTGFGTENSLPLVTDKALTLRVYVDRTSLPGRPIPATVTGSVRVTPGPSSIAPVNPGIVARPASDVLRGNADHTLNFFIPPGLCRGNVSFGVTVFDPDHSGDPAYTSLSETFTVAFMPSRFVRVFGVLFKGRFVAPPGSVQGPPTFLELLDALNFTVRTFPVSGINVTGHVQKEFDGDLRAPGSGCGPGWDALLTTLSNMRAASGGNELYVGLVPTPFTMTSPKFAGCATGSVGAGYAEGPHIQNSGNIIGHELGHVFGRKHAPCPLTGPDAPAPGSVDLGYPTTYGPMLPSASIGEFGYDPFQDKVFNPATWVDFMSYCPTKWISPYTYTELGKAIATSAAVSATADGAAPEELRSAEEPVTDEDEYLHLNFRIHEEGRVELLPSFHLKGPAPSGEAGTPTAITCDMLGPEDRIIERWRCRLTRPDREPDAPDLVFNEHLRWHAETRAIAFRRRGELCRRYELADAPPEVTVEVRRRGDRDHIARVDWKPTDKTAPLTYLLRFSHDDGATWRAVDADLTALGLEVDLDLLPGGESCRFQVVASSGIRTAVADSDAFALAVKPVQPYILEPPPDAVFDEGAVVTLRGLGYSPDFETTPFDDVTWHSNLEGHLGVGYQLALRTLRVGRHRITLSLPDGLGDQATAGVFIDLRRAE